MAANDGAGAKDAGRLAIKDAGRVASTGAGGAGGPTGFEKEYGHVF
jgi:hypothetical protein